MQVAYHLGAHATDEDRLIRCLMTNRDRLFDENVVVPNPNRYRRLIRETQVALNGQLPNATMQQRMFDEIIDDLQAERVILSGENFLGSPVSVFNYDMLYASADLRLPVLEKLLPAEQVEFHIALRNPATFIPALVKKARVKGPDMLLQGFDPMHLFWSEFIRRIRNVCPEAILVVWANEDSPMVWSDILLSLAGLSAEETPLYGADDMILHLMTQDGRAAFKQFIADNPDITAQERTLACERFLLEYARPNALRDDFDVSGWGPEWSDAVFEKLTENYEVDLDRIADMTDIDFIEP